ncbi:MAG: hypothetical protein Q8R60_08675 [Mycobacteriales bacterium]|nr:hypothetical protein [Mycobacteriales bacterium]
MGRATITRLEEHPNLDEVLGVLAQLAHVTDADLPRLAGAWHNSPAAAEARARALAPDSPLVCEVLAAFDAVSALFEDDLTGAPWVTVDTDVAVTALKAVRDAIAAAYARPVLSRGEHGLLMAAWREVYPTAMVGEPDLGPRATTVKALLGQLPRLSVRCHDPAGRELYDGLVASTMTGESDRELAGRDAYQAAVMTSRRRVWALVRRTAAEGVARPCPQCRRSATVESDRDAMRVLVLVLDAACALLVADALPDDALDALVGPVRHLIPAQRSPSA